MNFKTTFLAGAVALMAIPAFGNESGEPMGYHLHDLVFTYRDSYNSRVTGAVDGNELIDGKEYYIFRLQPSPEDVCLGPDATPIRFDGQRVYWCATMIGQGSESNYHKDLLLYDFDAGVGDKCEATLYDDPYDWFPSFHHYRIVVQTREAKLFGMSKRVQRIVGDTEEEQWFSSPYQYATGNFWYGISGDAFVVIEDIGNVTLSGTYAFPMACVLPTCFVPPFEPCSLEQVASADGKYRYTHTGLGVSPGNQIMRLYNVWEYYSDTPEYEALHEMMFDGTAERDGKLYGCFYTRSAIIRDKATGEVKELINDDPEHRCVLMRENLGEVYVRGLNDEDETLMYDFMLQEGDEFMPGKKGQTLKVVEMPVTYMDFDPDSSFSYDEPVKTYSFEGMTEKMGITEYTGLWGTNAGTLVNPMFAGGSFGGVEWPWVPAADCTLARQYHLLWDYDVLVPYSLYVNPEVWEKAETLKKSADVSTVGADAETVSVCWYTLQGMPVSTPEHGHIYIRVNGSRAEKIAY